MKDFEAKVAAVTGAASGIGRGLALELARQGCHLALCCDRNVQGLQETKEQARQLGVNVTSQQLDVADRGAVHAWADQVAADHGKINLIFNNAGVDLASTIEGVSYEDFEWLMSINFWGVVYGTKAFLPHLKASGDGHVVNISSVFGLTGMPAQGPYNSSKFALRGFTDCLREELDMMDCGVSATSVHPGGIKTSIAKSGRVDSSIRALGFDERDFWQKIETRFITEPDKAARIIIRAVQKNKRRVLVGTDAYLFDAAARLLPSAYQPLAVKFVRHVMK